MVRFALPGKKIVTPGDDDDASSSSGSQLEGLGPATPDAGGAAAADPSAKRKYWPSDAEVAAVLEALPDEDRGACDAAMANRWADGRGLERAGAAAPTLLHRSSRTPLASLAQCAVPLPRTRGMLAPHALNCAGVPQQLSCSARLPPALPGPTAAAGRPSHPACRPAAAAHAGPRPRPRHRYLRATGGDAKHALRRIHDTLEWRRAERPEHIVCTACRANHKSHYMQVVGHDLSGRCAAAVPLCALCTLCCGACGRAGAFSRGAPPLRALDPRRACSSSSSSSSSSGRAQANGLGGSLLPPAWQAADLLLPGAGHQPGRGGQPQVRAGEGPVGGGSGALNEGHGHARTAPRGLAAPRCQACTWAAPPWPLNPLLRPSLLPPSPSHFPFPTGT